MRLSTLSQQPISLNLDEQPMEVAIPPAIVAQVIDEIPSQVLMPPPVVRQIATPARVSQRLADRAAQAPPAPIPSRLRPLAPVTVRCHTVHPGKCATRTLNHRADFYQSGIN